MSSFFDEDTHGESARKRRHIEESQQRYGGFPSGSGESGDNDDEEERPVLTRTGGGGGGGRVGLMLLQSMNHATPTSSSTASLSPAPVGGAAQKIRVVGEYVPLSVGGFMESAAETVMGDIHNVRQGDIMCLRGPAATTTTASTKSGAGGEMRFVKEAELTEEERRYGKRLSSDMLQELFEVGRVDRATNSLEGLFLDGTRRKLKLYAARPAGFVETELFRQWKHDPSTRPVRTVYASTDTSALQQKQLAPPLTSSHSRKDEGNQPPTATDNNGKNNSSGAEAPMPWWVTPQLIVRVVEESAGDLFGKKFVVKSVARKEGKIRLAPWQPTGAHGKPAESSLVDIVGCEALETLVPKVGEQGIVVLGNMRGELVRVDARLRSAEGGLTAVKVTSTRTGDEFTVGPHEVCQLALAR
ncbi:Trypanosoma vivax [Trypanosoma grayi]|uniref:Trypanosoma vivax n=1 Tax=Trypanosoma grayi TaxID=71804 RepID=UPI0004F4889A|nr:Trypanosoma vivax [Trypanosoma grayi]KEG09996.1 Trypanosoma vivax [Trypanosoma grayi]